MSTRTPDPAAPDEAVAVRGWLPRLLEPPALFTAITLVLLAVIWGSTWNLANHEQVAAQRAAAGLTAELADIYEAQVLRALREIDLTLKLVSYALEDSSPPAVLRELRDRELLPHARLFTVSLVDASGAVVATTDPGASDDRALMPILESARATGAMVVSPPQVNRDGESVLHFARRRAPADGRFAGIVTVSVHAGYFVSTYESQVFGERGVLGLLGTDGVFRALRSGDTLSPGLVADYAALVSDDADEGTAEVQWHGWDDTRRYSIARNLFEFPLAIVVGLAEEEQHATAADLRRQYRQRAGAASALLLAVMALLGGLSWRLQQARARAQEERIEHARRLEHLAFHDNLTDLPNRASFSRLLIQGMQQARRYNRRLALLFLDLDRFKVINDSLGHEAGDELLQEIGRRLRSSVRESDIVARLGGDEFVVLLPEIDTRSQVIPVAEKVLAAAARPFTLAGQEVRVTVSVGVTLFPDDGGDEQTLMKNADVAMYHAKEQGKNNFQFFSQALSTDSLDRLALESSLRNALEHREFRLYCQARHSMSRGLITGMEALVYWQHPELGLLPPRKFVPLAEEIGLISAIGRWALKTACLQNVAWLREGLPPLVMAVNLSAGQFIDESLVEDIAGALKDSGMDPQLLEVGITESIVLRDIQQTIRTLKSLKQMGVRVAIDDFGTGYSALSTLQQFPIDTIKIPRAFVGDRVDHPNDAGLATALVALGRSLSLTLIAKGVESGAQSDFLRTPVRDELQGFYTDQPLPAEDFAQRVRQQSGR